MNHWPYISAIEQLVYLILYQPVVKNGQQLKYS